MTNWRSSFSAHCHTYLVPRYLVLFVVSRPATNMTLVQASKYMIWDLIRSPIASHRIHHDTHHMVHSFQSYLIRSYRMISIKWAVRLP